MPTEVAICAEGLGKRYRLGERIEDGARYATLRDVVAPANLLRQASALIRSRADRPPVSEFWALRDVNFEILRGETIGVIGRNGAGKSTLLKVLSRITEPTKGRVTIVGRVASLLEIGTGFHPELTGRENIYLNGALLGMRRSEISRKFDEIVEFAGVDAFLDTPVKRYSSGMYVRLAFAVAAHLEPELLVIDEVLAVGDAEFQKKCLGKMSEIAGDGRTVLFVSHNMSAISALCNKTMLLERGTLATFGPTSDVVAQYASSVDGGSGAAEFPQEGEASIVAVRLDEQKAKSGDLLVEICFVSRSPISKPIGGIVVHSETGEPVWASNGIIHRKVPGPTPTTSGTLTCRSNKLPILSGRYSISAWLSDWQSVLDHKPDCISFSFGTEKPEVIRPPARLTGHLDWEACWHLT